MSDREVMQQALEALESMQVAVYNIGGEHVTDLQHAIEKADAAEKTILHLRAALAEPQDKPVAWRYRPFPSWPWSLTDDGYYAGCKRDSGYAVETLYTHPAPQRQPQKPVVNQQMTTEPVAKVELMTTGGNAGLATRIVEIDDHLRERLRPGQMLYTHPAPQRQPQEPVAGVVLNEEGRPALVEHGQEDWHCANRKARRLYTHPAPTQRHPQDEPVTLIEELRLAGLALIGLAEHDQHCDVFDLDDEGKHKECSCGYAAAISVITRAGKTATAPQRQPLTEDEAWDMWEALADRGKKGEDIVHAFARAIEDAVWEKINGTKT